MQAATLPGTEIDRRQSAPVPSAQSVHHRSVTTTLDLTWFVAEHLDGFEHGGLELEPVRPFAADDELFLRVAANASARVARLPFSSENWEAPRPRSIIARP